MSEADDILDRYYGPPQPNKLAGPDPVNRYLMNALMNSPDKTLTQRYAPNLNWMPDMLKQYLAQALTYAPLGFGFRGPIMSGPARGLTPQDFATAAQRARQPGDPAITGGEPEVYALSRMDKRYGKYPEGENSTPGLQERPGMLPRDWKYDPTGTVRNSLDALAERTPSLANDNLGGYSYAQWLQALGRERPLGVIPGGKKE